MAQLNFDATQFNPEAGIGQLSVGRHLVVIEKDEIKKANGSNGGYLQLDLKGVRESQAESGAYRLNLFAAGENAAKTIDIASRQLSAVCHAVGVMGINGDTSVLWNLPFMVEVAYQKGHNPATDGADAKGYTEVKRVLTADGQEIKAGVIGGGQQNNQGNFGQQNGQQNTQQNQNPNQGNAQFGQNQQQNQNANQGQQGQQGGAQFGQQNQNPQGQQGGNGGGQQGGWQPGQGNQGGGQQWQPRT